MTRKPSMPFRRLPVDFRDEPPCVVPIVRRSVSRRTSHDGESHSPNAFVLDFGYSNFKIHNSKFNSRGFTLIEILVVLVLLSLIVFALMAVFSATQRAFRASLTQSDTLQGGRSVMDLIAADLQAMTPSDASSNTFVLIGGQPILFAPVNFYVSEQTSPQLSPPMPLFQSIITSPSGSEVTNILENIFILSKNNINGVPSWVGTGYSVNTNLPDGTLYPLYRFYMTTNLSSGIFGPVGLFNAFYSSQYTNSTIWSHLMDGVVRLTAQTYDTNGVVMTNGYANPQNFGTSFHVRFVRFTQDQYGVVDSVFYSNAVPASVQIELGTLEDRTLQHAEGLSGANQSNYLAGAAGQLHVFRQRVWIRNLDPTAYQQ
jgi:prepilin-type N-terminal cleavage/methylation domain-containing protein